MVFKIILGFVLFYFFVRIFWNVLHKRPAFHKIFSFRTVGNRPNDRTVGNRPNDRTVGNRPNDRKKK